MLVFWEERLVLLATPKTGSTAFAEALAHRAMLSVQRPPHLKHVTVHRFHTSIRPWLEEATRQPFRVVAQIREPRDWLASWYRYRRRGTDVPPQNSTAGMDFDAFVQGWCAAERPSWANVGSQARFLRPHPTGRWLDRLFRHDEPDALADFLRAELGESFVLPRLNVSPPGATDLSPRTERLLHRRARDDFAFYAHLRVPASD
jgi:hypothetical protein